MRRSVTAVTRGFALGASLCVLGGAAGCGRETFDLLAVAGAAGSFSGTFGESGSSGAASADSGSGGLGGSVEAGAGGRGSAGAAGRRGFPEGGTGGAGGNAQCANNPQCAENGGSTCTASTPFCTPCQTYKDCPTDTPSCDAKSGRCYKCRRNSDCPATQACNTLAMVCATKCKGDDDCNGDANHRVCNTDFDVCVSCMAAPQCSLYDNGGNDTRNLCYFSACVQCFEDWQCQSQNQNLFCVAGRCQKTH